VSDKLKKTIDRMVEDSIRRILPAVMNEVLLQTIANSNVIRESAAARQAQRPAPQPTSKGRKPTSLNQLLDPEAGADFYQDPRAAVAESLREEAPPVPRGQVLAQRIQSLPPELQHLAEGVDLDDDGGEMWDSDVGDSVPTAGMGPPLERAAQVAGLDFSRMRQAIQVTEKKAAPRVSAADKAANAQFEENRLKRLREQLNGGKPLD
jgi:hypothetical protein